MSRRPAVLLRRTLAGSRLGLQSVLLTALLATTWLIVGTSLKTADAATVSAGRTGFTVIGLAALAWVPALRSGAPETVRQTSPPLTRTTLLGLTGVTAYTVLSTVAIALAGPALPSLVVSLTPAVVLIADCLLRRARPSGRALLGTGVAVAGAVLYVLPRLTSTAGHNMLLGAVAASGAMVSMAFYGLYFATVNRGYRGPMAPRILPIFTVGAIPLVIWAATDPAVGDVRWSTVALLAVLGTVIYVPAYLLQHKILVSAGASYAALLGLAVAPVVGISSAILRLADPPAPVQLAATAVTLTGMLVALARPSH
ncbi:DMT family transporter [Actinoplanes sp. NPDC049265]|uniref:DMT family transporter n=1 Tax=Actinoplanes sp. NPDC049265 TaxID=3363902 RepID=UPI00370FA7ED